MPTITKNEALWLFRRHAQYLEQDTHILMSDAAVQQLREDAKPMLHRMRELYEFITGEELRHEDV